MGKTREQMTVIGGGKWGVALAQLAAEAGREVMLWKRDPAKVDALNKNRVDRDYWPKFKLNERVQATASLEEAAGFSKLVFAAVPSHAFRRVMSELGAHLAGDHVVLHAVKGIETDTRKRMLEIIREETPARRIGALAGPNLAEEIMAGRPAAALAASRYPEVVERAQAALVSERFRVYGSRDPLGVEFAGALNNVIAVFAGIVHGLEQSECSIAMVITRGAAEIQRFGVRMGAQPETFFGLAGIGDLIISCTSEHSPNREVGLRIANGEKPLEVIESIGAAAESVRTVRPALELAKKAGVEIPIAAAVNALLHENADPSTLRKMLMTRAAKYE